MQPTATVEEIAGARGAAATSVGTNPVSTVASRPCSDSLRHTNSWHGLIPCRRAVADTSRVARRPSAEGYAAGAEVNYTIKPVQRIELLRK